MTLSAMFFDLRNLNAMFFALSIGFGISLAADAFSVSLANGLNEPNMKKSKMIGVAGVFAFFQALMPFIGWLFIKTLVGWFEKLSVFIPWIALALLSFIGVKMLIDGIKNKEEEGGKKVGIFGLLVQGVATSIDALSAGFGLEDFNIGEALISVSIIGIITFGICVAGVIIGKKFGTHLAGKAAILGGIILILIGIEIFVTGILDIDILDVGNVFQQKS